MGAKRHGLSPLARVCVTNWYKLDRFAAARLRLPGRSSDRGGVWQCIAGPCRPWIDPVRQLVRENENGYHFQNAVPYRVRNGSPVAVGLW